MFMSRGRPMARQPCRTGPGSHGMVQENLGLRLIFLKVKIFFLKALQLIQISHSWL